MTNIEYEKIEYYEEDRMPRACFDHGDRTCFILTDESRELVSNLFGVNMWSEYDASINFFKDGTVNLMKLEYNNYYEEFQEEELYVLTAADKNKIYLSMK